jgi:glutamate 5-kinase
LLRVASEGENLGTLFLAGTKLKSRKHWLAFTTHPRGTLTLDDGAVQALLSNGNSLLPSGISKAEGEFGVGDTVSCVDLKGNEIARGLIGYDAAATRLLVGASTQEIERRLGYSTGDEIIHRDDLVLTRDFNFQSDPTKRK